MAQQVNIMSTSASSNEYDSFQSSSMSYIVVDGSMEYKEGDTDVGEDEELMLIKELTDRVSHISDALVQSHNTETLSSSNDLIQEKEHLRHRIRQLENDNAALELSLKAEIESLKQQVEETKNVTMTTSVPSGADNLNTIVNQLTLQNSELKEQLEASSSHTKMIAIVKNKTKQLNAKEQIISDLNNDIEDLKTLLLEEQETASNERIQLQQEIMELRKTKTAPKHDNSQANKEELKKKEDEIERLKGENEDLQSLILEEQETAQAMQDRITELEKSKKISPTSTLYTCELRAKEDELKRKDEQIAMLQKEKEEMESHFFEEKENLRYEKEQLESRCAPSDNTRLLRQKEALDQRCVSLQKEIDEMKGIHGDELIGLRQENDDLLKEMRGLRGEKARLEAEIIILQKEVTNQSSSSEEVERHRENAGDTASHQQQLDELTERHEAEMTSLRKNHNDAIKEQQTRAKAEINQLKRELSSLKRNTSPEEAAANSDELKELQEKLKGYEIAHNKLTKKKDDLLKEMRGLRGEKARLEAELIILQKEVTNQSSSSEEVERHRENAYKFEQECENYKHQVLDLEERIQNLQTEAQENRVSSNRGNKEDDNLQNLLVIYNSLSKITSVVARRNKEDRVEKKNPRSVHDAILRLSDIVTRAGMEHNDLLDLALKEKEFEKMKREEAEKKLVDGKIRASQQLTEACQQAKVELAAQFAEHVSHQRQFIDFLQTRLELVTSPFFEQRMQPVPAYNGCSHFVGQPLPGP